VSSELALALAVLAAGSGFDHTELDGLLQRHVAVGRVDYDAFARAPGFARYLTALGKADPEALAPRERLALWIDAYNAYTIRLIVAHGERESIRNINRTLGLFPLRGPWRERLAVVGGTAYTLDEIEAEIVALEPDEPRVHFALACAARGAPPLRSEAYTGELLEAQLADQARLFILGSPDKNRVDVVEGILWVSPVFVEHREQFGGDDASIARFIAGYYPPGPERRALEEGRLVLRQTPYDWRLNGTAGRE
jgi:Protein of unknown function, DUF547